MTTYTLERVYLPTETLGSIYDEDRNIICKTMELPWLDNARGKSCFPEGSYKVTKEPPILPDDPDTLVDESGGRKPRDYWHFRLPSVPKRSGILIHKITYVKDLQGCIGVGEAHLDLNKDGVPDMVGSTNALKKMTDTMPDEFILVVKAKMA